jgi:FkbM family methyltransferase
VVRVAGSELALDERFALDREIYRGLFEVGLVAPLVQPGDSCIDVGANVGLYSVLFAARSVGGRVLAFEPTPTFERLRDNLRPFPTATAFNFALGAETDTLRIDPADGDHHASFRGQGDAGYEVDVRPLDDVAEAQAMAEIDFLKVDVEGWESQVMAGASGLWAERRIAIALVETNAGWGDPVDYLETVEGLGYRCFEIRLRLTAGRLRKVVDLQPLNLAAIPPQINVLIVRPDRLSRLTG